MQRKCCLGHKVRTLLYHSCTRLLRTSGALSWRKASSVGDEQTAIVHSWIVPEGRVNEQRNISRSGICRGLEPPVQRAYKSQVLRMRGMWSPDQNCVHPSFEELPVLILALKVLPQAVAVNEYV
ncbi:unnamed protein product [Durusdinium trenchii]|uniref:Uncharacterized protein n=1 Tax=Durusdinium trenchii TaxID=1381693 RepID=A0ABP0JUW1_9DINO